MHFKKLFAFLLTAAFILSLCACDDNSNASLPQPNQFIETQNTVADIFNTAIQKLNAAGSYTMSGNVSSVSEMPSSGVLTTVHAPIECSYQDGKMLLVSDHNILPHTTYFDGEHYYYQIPTDKYFTTTNDHTDYAASDYLREVNAEIVLDPKITVNDDGTQTLTFKIPFAIYASPALEDWLGIVIDETYEAKHLNITATVNSDGFITYFNLSFLNDTDFVGEQIHQEILVGMTLSNYSSTVVTVPSDLDAYEDWSVAEDSEGLGGPESASPEDME